MKQKFLGVDISSFSKYLIILCEYYLKNNGNILNGTFFRYDRVYDFLIHQFVEFVAKNANLVRKWAGKHLEALRQKQNLISLLKIFFHEEPDPEKLAYHRFHHENLNHDLFLELYNTDYNYFHFLLTKKEIFIPNSLTYDTITLLEENFKDNECEAVVDEFYRWF